MSNETNLGGRPRHHDGEVKKSAIAVRTAPSIRDALKKAADESGRSITQEVEARLVASLERDGGTRTPETERLLTEIGNAIAEIESWTGKRWHKDRKTYGAILQMLERGPAFKRRVDDPKEDEIVAAAWEKYFSIWQQITQLVDGLNQIGITSTADRARARPRGGLFGRAAAPSNSLLSLLGTRWMEKSQVESEDSGLTDNLKTAAMTIIGQLEKLDQLAAQALTEWQEAQKPYIEAEQEGRSLYKSRKREAAERARQEGTGFDWADMMP